MRFPLLLLLLSACIIDAPTFHERDGGADPVDASPIDADPDGTPGNAVLSTEQAPHGFGDVAVDGMSAPLDVIVENTGTDPTGKLDVMLIGGDAGHFEIVDAGTTDCDGATLEPDATCTARVRFHPTAAGAQAAALEISASPGGSASVALTGNGLSAGQLEITAGAALAFSTIEIQSSAAAQTITVHNTGDLATATLETFVGDPTSYSISADTCDGSPLAGDDTCTVNVVFNPATVGSHPSQISIRESPTVGSPASATGTGTARLQVTKTGTGAIASSPGGINCAGGCSTQTISFSETPISLTATDGGGFAFDGWSGACASSSTTMCSVALTAPLTSVGATFVRVFQLDVATVGSGVVTTSPSGVQCGNGMSDCSELYETGTSVTLTATPDANFEVYQWSVAGCTAGMRTCTVAMDQARSVTVEFRRQYILTVTPSGTGSGTIVGGPISCPGTCVAPMFVGSQVTLTETPSSPGANSQMSFSGWGFGACASLTTTCLVNMDADQTVTPYFTLRHRLAITLTGTGSGKVTPTGGSACTGGTCTIYYEAGTAPTVTALTNNATGSYFKGFSGACNGVARVCNPMMDAPKSIAATFSPQPGNLMFVSSTQYAANLGGTAPYDAACNALATGVGINTVDNDGFIAWMSDDNSLARSRVGASRGFYRLDGLPFADDQATLLAYPTKIFHPIVHDENGVNPGVVQYFTATDFVGDALSRNCANWSTLSEVPFAPYGSWGGSTHAAHEWTMSGPLQCANAERLLCVGKTSSAAVVPPAFAGKRMYLTNAAVVPGSTTPDAACAASKPSGAGTVHAVIATNGASGASKLSAGVSYVRPDGSLVGTGAQIAADNLTTGPWQTGAGAYVDSVFFTGAELVTESGTSEGTCANWTSSSPTLVTTLGMANRAYAPWWWNSGGAIACSEAYRFLCVED